MLGCPASLSLIELSLFLVLSSSHRVFAAHFHHLTMLPHFKCVTSRPCLTFFLHVFCFRFFYPSFSPVTDVLFSFVFVVACSLFSSIFVSFCLFPPFFYLCSDPQRSAFLHLCPVQLSLAFFPSLFRSASLPCLFCSA